ncbi:bifunctional aminoglycoside phosphotransferase/ATP-binding protein [Paraburkholderia graminis]|uniref:Aminoglycoside phosphotransferase family enzyme/predicted kinase n=1 Tax=Paraburkholderia graminis TaxID=60548 RepID=A0ABD5CRS8_9BURK|nr:AAA family ATPase [Paraburkholderia graminis]MDR6207917.1 aminoglycoside phosphotransferase family enzyme/predicted kinase [Paraburkholderia graminis]
MAPHLSAALRLSMHARQRERLAQRGWRALDRAMQRPSTYRHPASRIRRIETHISVVYLAGRYAYKLKKPVDAGFVDFTRADVRDRACKDECRLNRRFSPELYCGVTAIMRRGRVYRAQGTGHVTERAVRMRRFEEREVFAALHARSALGFAEVDALAVQLASFHRRAAHTPPRAMLGSSPVVREQMQTVLKAIERETGTPLSSRISAWCEREGKRLAGHFDARRAGGFVRECHGDLHLGNIVRRAKRVRLFDCIEFDDNLRWIDVASDLSFALMDLQALGRQDLAARLLNGWLQRTGDFAALPALRYYIIYRALVRALVALLKARQSPEETRLARAAPYLKLVDRLTMPQRPYLLLCHGYCGSGKSVASEALASLIGAVRLSSDVERKRGRLFAPIDCRPLPAASYSPQSIDQLYETLLRMAEQALLAGYPALIDATFLKRLHRARFVALASTLAVPVLLLDSHARAHQLAERVRARAAASQGESDAGPLVLIRQLANEEPLSPEEMQRTVSFDTEVPIANFSNFGYWGKLLQRLCALQATAAPAMAHGESGPEVV